MGRVRKCRGVQCAAIVERPRSMLLITDHEYQPPLISLSVAMNRARKTELVFLAGVVVSAAIFILAPEIDLRFSGLFYNEAAGFYLREIWWVRFLYEMVHPLVAVLILVLLAALGYNLARRRSVGPFDTRTILYLLTVFALGPGLMVNVVFKSEWGRARPRDIVEFGGERSFTPAFVISDQCERNCSFPSGHASIPFALSALGFVFWHRRRLIYTAAALFGGLVGFGRILQGAHFLSDVIFSGLFVFIIAYLLARYAFKLPERGSA
jgi:lipid A 4'-phosphatase